jgi:signal transduction histidine kinase
METSISLGKLVSAALKGDARGGITNLLKEIANLTKSFGCVLWRATENANPPAEGELTMLAAWFKAEKSSFGLKSAGFNGTVTGKAATEQCGCIIENDLIGTNNPNSDKPFFRKHALNRVVACRFEYLPATPDAKPRLGVVLIFRKSTEPAYLHDSDAPLLRQICQILPFLYSGARQKASFSLLKEVAEILRKSRAATKSIQTTPKKEKNTILRSLVSALSGTFHAIETSIFLENERQPGTFTCVHTSSGPCAKTVRKDKYEPTVRRGFSALCLLAKEPIRVHDQLNPQFEINHWRKRYPDFQGPQRPDLAELILKKLGNPDPPPPLSMMVAPIVADGEALGFLRCWVAKSGPAYFSSDDLELLRLVADYLAQTVAAWKQERLVSESRKREHQAFTKFAQTAQTVDKGRTEQEIPLAVLGLVRQLIPEAAFNTIRIRTASPDQLVYYAYTGDSNYGVDSKQLMAQMVKHKQLLSDPSYATSVVKTGKLKHLRKHAQLSKHHSDVAAESGEMIIAPISVDGRVEALLDLRSSKGVKFSAQASAITSSITTLLSLQVSRVRAEKRRLDAEKQEIETRAKTDRDLAENERAVRDAFEDVSHQIKSPLGEAARRIEHSSKRFQGGAISQELEGIATLLRRAELTAKLIGLFANLAKGKQLNISGTPHTPVELVRIAGEICENQRPRISPRRNIRIDLDVNSFYKHAPAEMAVDSELFQQALNNLVDNAVKYSYPNTSIRILGSPSKNGGFTISVINKGLPIKPHELTFAKQRNWRGELASRSSGEGNGLGLWIVEHIMLAHSGSLQILPTRPADGITEIRLIFKIF